RTPGPNGSPNETTALADSSPCGTSVTVTDDADFGAAGRSTTLSTAPSFSRIGLGSTGAWVSNNRQRKFMLYSSITIVLSAFTPFFSTRLPDGWKVTVTSTLS